MGNTNVQLSVMYENYPNTKWAKYGKTILYSVVKLYSDVAGFHLEHGKYSFPFRQQASKFNFAMHCLLPAISHTKEICIAPNGKAFQVVQNALCPSGDKP